MHCLLLSMFLLYYCTGMRVDSWPIGPTGLCFDRAWALVDSQGKALTQKSHPKLALVHPVINLADKVMVITAPGFSEVLVVPLDDMGKGNSSC